MGARQRVVIKIGSSTLTTSRGEVNDKFLASLATQISALKEQHYDVVVVSSGAIAVGLAKLGIEARPSDMASLQAAASVGSVVLAHAYDLHFAIQDIKIGQVLLTKGDITTPHSYELACNTFEQLLAFGVVPIVNENDTVAVDEIKFGDNDQLAALVGIMIKAKIVLLLSDIDGLYDFNPQEHADAHLVGEVCELTDDILAAAGGAGSASGSGGMTTKLQAAAQLMDNGISMVICDGRRKDVILDVIAGEQIGTTFRGV